MQEDFDTWMCTMPWTQSVLQIWRIGTSYAETTWTLLLQVMCKAPEGRVLHFNELYYVFAHTLFFQWIVCSVFRYSHTSGNGTIGKSWLDIECKGTRIIPRIVGIRFVNSVMIDTWTTMNCWSTCGEIITSAISVTQMELRSITGKRPILVHLFLLIWLC